MTVTLAKGANLLLADEAPGLQRLRVGLGWDGSTARKPLELDGVISVVSGETPTGGLVLAHQVPNPEESVTAHQESDQIVGDAEKLVVKLDAVPTDVSRLLFGLTIYDAVGRSQSFQSVRGVYIRVLNDDNGIEIARYTLTPETGRETAMVLGELYRNPRGWKFRAVGQGYRTGLSGVAFGDAGQPSGDIPMMRPLAVSPYLGRSSIARSRRSLAEHLHPPQPVQPPKPVQAPRPAQPSTPAPPASRPPSKPATPPPPPPAPVRAPAPAPAPAPARPASAAPSSRPTAPPKPAAAPPTPPKAPAHSTLDLSEPEEQPAPQRAGRSAPRVEYGEHSSRYRQRQERVSALDDDHPATAWTPQKTGTGGLTVTLTWEPLQTSSGLPRPSDLHLGAFWQAADRTSGLLQTQGGAISAPGSGASRTVLRLGRRDEREGQTIFADITGLATFRRVFVFAYGQHGSPEWDQLRPTLSVVAPSGEELTLRFGEARGGARLCLIASLHMVDGDVLVRRENAYFDGLQSEAAARYGWALEWNPDGMTLRDA